MVKITSPTVRRRRLGHRLRQLREDRGYTLQDVGDRLEWSAAKISRIETGRVSVRPKDVREILNLYGVHEASEQDLLVQLARDTREKGWWEAFGKTVPPYLGTLFGLETEATEIQTYQLALVPGLLQTEEYARAVEAASLYRAEEVEPLVNLRMTRKETLRRADPPEYSVLIDEGVIRRRIGGVEVMSAQLRHLAHVAQGGGGVTLQIVPFSPGVPTPTASFTLLGFKEDGADQKVIYVEHLSGSLYLEGDEDILRYSQALVSLRAAALNPDQSVAMLLAAAEKP